MKKILLALVMICIMASPSLLFNGAVVQGQEEFMTYEDRGPRIDYLNILIYKTVEAEVLALQKGDIDMIDWPLPAEKIPEVQANPNLKIMTFPDYGFTYIGVNVRRPPLDDIRFRQALAYLIDNDKILADVLKGYGEILPAGLFTSAYATGGWQNPNIKKYTFNPEKAKEILDAAGYTVDPATGKRLDPRTGKPLRDMILLSRIDDPGRKLSADLFAEAAQKIGLPIKAEPRERGYISPKVYAEYDYDMFTGGWILTDIPDWVYDFFHSDQLPEAHDMEPWWYNFVGMNNATLDKYAWDLKYGLSVESAKEAALKAQEILAEQVPYLPLYSPYNIIGVNAEWEGYVRRTGRTDATVWWSILNAHKKGVPFGGTFRLGFKSDIEKLNPFDSTWYWDWMVLDKVYDTLLYIDPLRPPDLKPWAAKSWTVEQWEPEPGKKAPLLTFNLLDNITWHDGTKFTSKDVKFTLEYLRDKESAYFFSYVQFVKKVEIPDDYTAKVYFSEPTPWAANWIGGGIPILPEHIWSKVEDPSTYEAWREGKLIGYGPFILQDYKPGEYVLLRYNSNYFRRHPEKTIRIDAVELPSSLIVNEERSVKVKILDPAAQAVINATVGINIKKRDGTLVTSLAATHIGDGVYEAKAVVSEAGDYVWEVTASYMTPIGEFKRSLTAEFSAATPFPTLLVGGIVVIVVIVIAAGYIVLRRRRKPAPSPAPSG